jgi:hypothetical protein
MSIALDDGLSMHELTLHFGHQKSCYGAKAYCNPVGINVIIEKVIKSCHIQPSRKKQVHNNQLHMN